MTVCECGKSVVIILIKHFVKRTHFVLFLANNRQLNDSELKEAMTMAFHSVSEYFLSKDFCRWAR